MTTNLIAELVRTGVRPQDLTKTVAKAASISERSARNKINGITDFTVSEAVAINAKCFGGCMSIKYLFAQSKPTGAE